MYMQCLLAIMVATVYMLFQQVASTDILFFFFNKNSVEINHVFYFAQLPLLSVQQITESLLLNLAPWRASLNGFYDQ